jgi:transposase
MSGQMKRKYTAQTKNDAVVQVITAGISLAQVARTYEMPIQTLDKWVRTARQNAGSTSISSKPQVISDEQALISRLKAENARLTMERDILKKATAYFAKDSL